MSIVVDPGHGGRDPGTVNQTGLGTFEKDITLPVVLMLEQQLAKYNIKTILTQREKGISSEFLTIFVCSSSITSLLFSSIRV